MDAGPLLLLLLFWFLWIFPLWRILYRTGHHPALALIGVFPLFYPILLWWLAYAHWPRLRRRRDFDRAVRVRPRESY